MNTNEYVAEFIRSHPLISYYKLCQLNSIDREQLDTALRDLINRNIITVISNMFGDTIYIYNNNTPSRRWLKHSDMVRELKKAGSDIVVTLNPTKVDLWHAATGIATEAGELLDAVKKHVIYNQSLNRENIIEELGDIEFYMEQLRQNCGINREESLEANMRKLEKRYRHGYSDVAAQQRADKEEK